MGPVTRGGCVGGCDGWGVVGVGEGLVGEEGG